MTHAQSTNYHISGDQDLAGLRAGLHGELLLQGDPNYQAARKVWNGAIDRYPTLIVRCADANDVRRAVEFARQTGIEVALRGGGHSSAGFCSTEGGLVIDLSPMKSIRVRPDECIAHAQPGVTLGELIQATQEYGLATNTGTVSDTGIAGLTLGGGVGLLMGKYGLTCDNVRSFEVIQADGQMVQASSEENPDLYWALRGGGGNFGVVTGFEYQLHKVGPVLGGMIAYPLARARDVLRFYRDMTLEAPDELTMGCAMLTAPSGHKVIGIAVCYCGELSDGQKLVDRLRQFGAALLDLIKPMPYAGLFTLFDPMYRNGRPFHMKGTGITTLSDEAADALADTAGGMASPHSHILVTHLHGAAARVGTTETAFAYREPHHDVLHVAAWEDAAQQEDLRWLQRSHQLLQPFASQPAYVNFMDDEGPARVRVAYGPNYERLVALKNKYDPTNMFHLNQNIEPNVGRQAGQ